MSRYGNNEVTDLSQWVTQTSLDSNSFEVDPLYYSDQDLHIKEISLFDSGAPVSLINEDIDGENRDPGNPSIGADEVAPPATDAGIAGIKRPTVPFKAGTRDLRVTLRNYGTDPLTSADIVYSINNSQSTYSWSGSIASGDTTHVKVGSHSFVLGGTYDLVVWSESPNGNSDLANYNDTTKLLNAWPGLSGVYTIGGSTPDFSIFTDAVNTLNNGGVIDSAIFEVRTGNYQEQLTFREFPGTDCSTPVVFRLETGDTADVNLVYSASSDSNYTVQLNGAKGVEFHALTIEALNSSYGRVIDLRNNASCNEFIGNRLVGDPTNSSTTNHAVIYSPAGSSSEENDTLNLFDGNAIVQGSYGMYMEGYQAQDKYLETGNVISRNQFLSQSYHGLFAENQGGFVVEGNYFKADSTRNDYEAIYGDDLNSGAWITNNRIFVPQGRYGIFFR